MRDWGQSYPMWKKAYSQAGWSLVTNGVTESRLEVHRLRHMVERVVALCKNSEYLSTMLGDVAQDAPRRLENLETSLDRTNYALSRLGDEILKGQISHSDLTLVEESMQDSRRATKLDPEKVARWFNRQVHARQRDFSS